MSSAARSSARGAPTCRFHWYCEHLYELDDEQFRAAWIEHNARLTGSIDVDVPVAIPRDTWEDVVKADTDDADPKEVTPADISKDTLIDLVEPEFDFRVAARARRGLIAGRHPCDGPLHFAKDRRLCPLFLEALLPLDYGHEIGVFLALFEDLSPFSL